MARASKRTPGTPASSSSAAKSPAPKGAAPAAAPAAANKPAAVRPGDVNPNAPALGTPSAPKTVLTLTHDQVAKRAYEIWVAKGRPQGRDLENWQQAERELRTQLGIK